MCAASVAVLQAFLYVRTCKDDNEYAHPLDLVPLVDLNLGRVVHVDMYDQPATMPPLMVNYHKNLAKDTTGVDFRADLKPLNITQPEVCGGACQLHADCLPCLHPFVESRLFIQDAIHL